MKPTKHQEIHTTIEETPSKNRDTNKKDYKVHSLKAGCFE